MRMEKRTDGHWFPVSNVDAPGEECGLHDDAGRDDHDVEGADAGEAETAETCRMGGQATEQDRADYSERNEVCQGWNHHRSRVFAELFPRPAERVSDVELLVVGWRVVRRHCSVG